jgi:hypothetical protein
MWKPILMFEMEWSRRGEKCKIKDITIKFDNKNQQ